MARVGKEQESIKAKMTQTKMASPNGYKVESFFEGQEYTLTPILAEALEGCFVVVGEKEEVEVKEEKEKKEIKEKKNAGAAPKNKAVFPRENK